MIFVPKSNSKKNARIKFLRGTKKMRKVFAFLLCAMFVLGDVAIFQLNAAAKTRRADERAENLLRAARAAIGGEAAINAVTNLLMTGSITHNVKFPGETEQRTLNGNVEMAFEFPDKFHKKIQIGDGSARAAESDKKAFVQEIESNRVEAPGGELKNKIRTRVAGERGSELARFAFGLLLKTSPALGALYYAGEGSVDGTAAEIIEARSENGKTVKLYLDKQSNLPLMISYRAVRPHQFIIREMKGAQNGGAPGEIEKDVIVLRAPSGEKVLGAPGEGKVVVRKKDENGNVTTSERAVAGATFERIPMEEAEFQIRFSDFRRVGELTLPHRLSETVNGEARDVTTIESYTVNAPNLAEKFKTEMIRLPRKVKVEQN
jgi:hypothetical protein